MLALAPSRRLSTVAVPILAAVVLTTLAPEPTAAQEALPEVPEELEEVRQALEKYRDPYRAVHDLYLSTVGCIEYPEGGEEGEMGYDPGAMGVHFINPQLLDGKVDPEKPEVLIYDREQDGSLRLVAAEWMVPKQAADERPSLLGMEFDGPMAGHEPLMPAGLHHYDLHVWLWTENPAGLSAPTNPAMECPESGYTIQEDPPAMVEDPAAGKSQ